MSSALRSVQSDRVFRFDEDIDGGGEGYIFPAGDGQVAKVYHEEKQTPERAAKLDTMVKNQPSHWSRGGENAPIVAWPVDLLEQTSGPRKGMVVGYLMPEVKGIELSKIYHRGDRRKHFPLIGYDYLLRCAASTAEVVASLHKDGYVIGDINESNFLVSGDGEITAIDADSFQVPDPSNGTVHHCTVGKPEYTPPELVGKNFSVVERKVEHDRYGLAVLIFQLLMGCHPTDTRYTGIGDRSDEYVFPYDKPKESFKPNYHPPKGALDFEILEEPLRKLFKQCFRDGMRTPAKRPSAEEWARTLRHAEKELTTCLWNAQHKYSPHLDKYGGFLKRCPWCKRKQDRPDGQDPFPSRFRVGKKRVDKKEKSGFLKVDMPGKREGIGVMGAVGIVAGYSSKYVLQPTGSDKLVDDGEVDDGDSNESTLHQQAPKRGYLRRFLLAAVVLLSLAWGVSSLADSDDLGLKFSSERAGPSYAVEINTENLNVRAGPSTSNEVLTTVNSGERLNVIDTHNDWYQVLIRANGREQQGWIHANYTKRVNEANRGERLTMTEEGEPNTSSPDEPGRSDKGNLEARSFETNRIFPADAVDQKPQVIERGEANLEKATEARRAGIEGRVHLRFVVTENGRVEDVQIVDSPHDSYSEVAIEEMQETRFRPGRKDGIPVKVRMSHSITYDFTYEPSGNREAEEASTSVSFQPNASTTAVMGENRFEVAILSGMASEISSSDTELKLKVRQKSLNFDGEWVRWGHILRESYLIAGGRRYDVQSAASDNLGGGRVSAGDTRTGTLVFQVNGSPNELDHLTLHFAYFPYRGVKSVRIPFSVR